MGINGRIRVGENLLRRIHVVNKDVDKSFFNSGDVTGVADAVRVGVCAVAVDARGAVALIGVGKAADVARGTVITAVAHAVVVSVDAAFAVDAVAAG